MKRLSVKPANGIGLPGLPRGASVRLAAVAGLPLILPSAQHGLRALVDAAAVQAGVTLDVVAEIDGLALLMDAVRAGLGATVQPGAAAAREPGGHLRCIELTDALARRAREELGAEVEEPRLALPDFRYRAVNTTGIVENEICPVFVARLASPLSPQPAEVMDIAWVAPLDLAAAVDAALPGFFAAPCGSRNFTTSSSDSADGFEVAPTNPVTPGVLRTAPHDSSFRSMRTRM